MVVAEQVADLMSQHGEHHAVLLALVAGRVEFAVVPRRRIDEPAPAGGVEGDRASSWTGRCGCGRQQLVETCPDEELRERLADFQRRHIEAHDRSFKLRQTINDCRTWAKSDRAERRAAKAAECEKELAEGLKQLAGLEKQVQAVRDAMLEP
jgi:hypothetical protein